MSATTLSRPLAARVNVLPPVSDSAALSASASEALQNAAFDALDKGKTHYTDRPGILPLREKAVAYIGETCGVELSADEVTITCGATEARFVTVKQLVKAGMNILCAGDGSPVKDAAALVDAHVTQDENADNIALVYLAANDPQARIDAILQAVASRENVYIVWDMSTGESSFHPAHNPALAARTITIGGVPEDLDGWRVGWLAGSKVANKLRAYKQSMTICTSSISQWAALGADLQGDA